MTHSSRVTKREILAHLERVGEARPIEIQDALGPEWQGEEKRVTLQKLLARMTGAGLLIRVRYGVYSASGTHAVWGIDLYAKTEDAIRDYLKSVGGRAKASAIHSAVYGPRNLKGGARSSWHTLVHRVLAGSDWFLPCGANEWLLSSEALNR